MRASSILRPFLVALALGLASVPRPVLAQREGYTYLSYVGSDVALVSKGEDDTTARVNMPVLAGDRLSTGASSRAEAILADGSVVRADIRTDLRFDRLARTYQSDDERDLIFLERGAIAVESRNDNTQDRAIRVDTDDVTIVFPDRGLFRVDTGRRGTEVYVQSGKAEVTARSGRALVQAGQYAFVSGSSDVEIEDADLPRDTFTRFVNERRERPHRSVTYVASDYDYDYSVSGLDDYGSWAYVSGVGRYCWRPTATFGWRPYSLGYWRYSPCGLTWVSYEPWGWLPYHYGSWSFDASFGWCWIPGVDYSPAWVYWSYSPGWMGWCPIGYYDTYYRTVRTNFGGDGGRFHYYPHLAGRVDLTRVDPRGWNYVSTTRVGARLDASRDIVRGDKMTFRPGDVGVIATTPLRIDRSGHTTVEAALQSAVRRVPLSDLTPAAPRGGTPSEGLAAILHRDATLSPAGREELKRSITRGSGADANRPVAPEAVLSPRRLDGGLGSTPGGVRGLDRPADNGLRRDGTAGSTAVDTGRRSGVERSWLDAPVTGSQVGPVERRGGAPDAAVGRGGTKPAERSVPDRPARADEGWRSQSPAAKSSEHALDGRPAARDDSSARGGSPGAAPKGPEDRPVIRRDDGWRAGGGDKPAARAPQQPPARRDDSGWRAPRNAAPPRSYDAPRNEPRREAPPARSFESPRSEPRRESPAPYRSYDVPRGEPRRESPPARSYEPRSEPRRESPPARSYEAPRREAPPAPRYEAPSRPPERSAPSAPAPSRGGESRGGRRP